jgi:hypothetical protein
MNSPLHDVPIRTAQDVFDRIDASALQDIVTRLVRVGPLKDVRYHLHRPIQGAQGYSGLTGIVSVQYVADNGCSGWVDLLLKWPRWATAESRWYPALMAAGAPVPAFYGSLRLRSPPPEVSDEVLVLEFLPHIGYHEHDALALAQTLGRFHALAPSILPELPQVTAQGSVAGWTEVWQRIPVHARAGELGSAIASLVMKSTEAWDRVLAALPRLAARADGFPRGVIHRDVSFQNTGWRSDRQVLLLFDVPQMAVGILAQEAQVLFPADKPLDPVVCERYTTTLLDHGGPSLSLADMVEAVAVVRPLAPLNFLWWATARSCDGQVDFTTDIEEGRRWYRAVLLENLESVLEQLGR